MNRLNARNVRVYMTLTGKADDRLPSGTGSGIDPDPAAFASFVTDAVGRFSALGVHVYALWNEPNLPGIRRPDGNGQLVVADNFLQRRCPAGSRADRANEGLDTAPLYRQLYDAGRQAARGADPQARILAGELSELKSRFVTDCGSTRKKRSLTTTYLRKIADESSGRMRTDGVAWHPYQHGTDPRHKEAGRIGIGRIGEMTGTVESLYREGRIGTPGDDSKVPRLWLTEFGYFNRPNKPNLGSRFWHSENRREVWLPRALSRAVNHPRKPALFVLYKTTEERPGTPGNLRADPQQPPEARNFPNFDTGFFDGRNGAVTGDRGYGKGDQRRGAYCSVLRFTRRNRFSSRNRPFDPSVQPDRCP